MHIPRIVIAGTNSGCGKTTITAGIMAALAGKGLKVQPFKVGPDYIDPMFHTFITGAPSRNLDSWMLGDTVVRHLFCNNSRNADIAVIEGVMGLYDGFGGTTQEGSTAAVSEIVKAPVILVVSGEGMSLSAAALIRGYIDFGPGLEIRGVIFNNIKSESHYRLLKEAVEQNTGIKAVGYMLKDQAIALESRHLGLVPSEEVEGLRQKIDRLALQAARTIDLEGLLSLAREACPISDDWKPQFEARGVGTVSQAHGSSGPVGQPAGGSARKVRIAVARDRAFNFYYRDNLDLLETLGAELAYFSPLDDSRLPEGTSGLYIGGGYPEVFARELSQNVGLKQAVKKAVDAGMPAYAECGGLMYLSRSLETAGGQRYEMVGAVPGESRMTASLQRFGYVEVEAAKDNVLCAAGDKIRAHEFHYSDITVDDVIERCYTVNKKRKSKDAVWNCGYKVNNLLAAYPHIHFWSNISFAEGFVNSCRKYSIGGNKT